MPQPAEKSGSPDQGGAPVTEPKQEGSLSDRLIAAVNKAYSADEGGGSPDPDAPPEKKEEKKSGAAGTDPKAGDPPKDEGGEKKAGEGSDPDPDPDDKVDADIKKATATMSAAHKAAFTNLRYSERDFKRKLAAAEKELAELKSQGANKTETSEATAEVEALKQELEATKAKLTEYDGVVKVSQLEVTDEYKTRIEAPRQAIAQEAEALAAQYKLDEASVIAAFRSNKSEDIAALTADMLEFDRYRFYDLIKGYRAISAEEGRMRQNAASELDRISKTRREQAEATTRAQQQEWEKAAPEVWDALTDEFPAIAPIDGDDEWNRTVEGVREFAKPERFGALTTREKVETLYRAAAFPVLKTEFEAMQKELAQAKAELEKYEKAGADLGAGGGGGASSAEEDPTVPLAERLVRRLQKAGLSS